MRREFVLFLLLPLMFSSCRDAVETKSGTSGERVVSVGVMCIDSVSKVERTTYVGTAEESRSVNMTFKYGGTIDRLNVSEGSVVRKGDIVATVSSSTLVNSQRTAQATLQQARDGYQRLKKVYESGSLAEVKWVEMLTNLEKAEANADMADDMLAESVMRAPFSGVVSAVEVEVGENVSPLKPIVRLISADEAVMRIAVSENEIAKVSKGDSAVIKVVALGDKVFMGRVVEKSVKASPLSHSYNVKVAIEDDGNTVLPGMIGRVTLNSDVTKGIVVPANAVLIGDNSKLVWLVKNGRATRREVVVAGFSGTGVMVSEGLQKGDTVIVTGCQKVSEGMLVNANK